MPTISKRSTSLVSASGLPLVLVVEDDPQLRQMLKWALEAEGFAVQTAGDGRHGIDLAATSRPSIVVLDYTLPLLDGAGFSDELRRMYTDVPILLITAGGRVEEKAARVGAEIGMAKPFDLDQLIAAVYAALGIRNVPR